MVNTRPAATVPIVAGARRDIFATRKLTDQERAVLACLVVRVNASPIIK